VARTSEEQWELADHLDWVLPYYDPETTEEAYMDEEIKRLQVVKSYLLLDAKREHAFDRITALAARIFDAPIWYVRHSCELISSFCLPPPTIADFALVLFPSSI
jgi:hypothetical protein